jgi:hypothetical protein
MFDALTKHMRNALAVRPVSNYPMPVQLPTWL